MSETSDCEECERGATEAAPLVQCTACGRWVCDDCTNNGILGKPPGPCVECASVTPVAGSQGA